MNNNLNPLPLTGLAAFLCLLILRYRHKAGLPLPLSEDRHKAGFKTPGGFGTLPLRSIVVTMASCTCMAGKREIGTLMASRGRDFNFQRGDFNFQMSGRLKEATDRITKVVGRSGNASRPGVQAPDQESKRQTRRPSTRPGVKAPDQEDKRQTRMPSARPGGRRSIGEDVREDRATPAPRKGCRRLVDKK